ncbi:MAG: hypothetical protein AAF770_00750 [Bacteroidota bacterium]
MKTAWPKIVNQVVVMTCLFFLSLTTSISCSEEEFSLSIASTQTDDLDRDNKEDIDSSENGDDEEKDVEDYSATQGGPEKGININTSSKAKKWLLRKTRSVDYKKEIDCGTPTPKEKKKKNKSWLKKSKSTDNKKSDATVIYIKHTTTKLAHADAKVLDDTKLSPFVGDYSQKIKPNQINNVCSLGITRMMEPVPNTKSKSKLLPSIAAIVGKDSIKPQKEMLLFFVLSFTRKALSARQSEGVDQGGMALPTWRHRHKIQQRNLKQYVLSSLGLPSCPKLLNSIHKHYFHVVQVTPHHPLVALIESVETLRKQQPDTTIHVELVYGNFLFCPKCSFLSTLMNYKNSNAPLRISQKRGCNDTSFPLSFPTLVQEFIDVKLKNYIVKVKSPFQVTLYIGRLFQPKKNPEKNQNEVLTEIDFVNMRIDELTDNIDELTGDIKKHLLKNKEKSKKKKKKPKKGNGQYAKSDEVALSLSVRAADQKSHQITYNV